MGPPPPALGSGFVRRILIRSKFSGATVKFGGKFARKPVLRIGSWPRGALTDHSPNSGTWGSKTPTRLALNRPDQDAGEPDQDAREPDQNAREPDRWGFQALSDNDSFRWFKLGMYQVEDMCERVFGKFLDDLRDSTELRDARELRDKHSMTATQLSGIFLKRIWNHILEQIASECGITKNEIASSELHVVIGIPANMDIATRGRLQRAVRSADIPCDAPSTIDYCIEPEAATIALMEHGAVSADLTVRPVS